jgi:FKBP-type peptidyl-prolyl cis-trans isomerase FkpA
MKKILLLFIVSAFVLGSCEIKESTPPDDNVLPYAEQLEIDIDKIEAYLLDNELVAESTVSGLYYIIDVEGTGDYPSANSIVEVEYEGRFLDTEVVFDSGTIEKILSGLILGWQEGMKLFKEGGSGTLFIPSGLAYGAYDYSIIPANSVLIFDVELISVSGSN